MERTTIEGIKYRVHFNDDPDCPISLSRIYRTGERRTQFIFGTKVTQVKQADGSWWQAELGHKGRSWSGR